MADPDEALIEAIARALCEIRCDSRWSEAPIIAHEREARAAYAAMVAHLGLVEEWERWCGGWKPTTAGAAELFREKGSVPSQRQTRRRLVSRWTEVDHGSE